MSLLLDALKKAEKAKDEAQRQADGGEDAHPRLEHALELEPAAAAAPPRRPATDNAQTPDPLAAERAAARKVFEAKYRESDPRLPFYAAIGLLALCGAGIAAYFWYQLRPAPALVNIDPPRPAGERQIAAARPPRPAPPPAASPATPSAEPSLPALPAATARRVVASHPAAKRKTVRRARARRARGSEVLRRSSPISAARQAPRIDPNVAAGYAAYQAGDFPAARRAYRQALGDDPLSRDALLGMAAVEIHAGRYAAADALYRRLLAANPRDVHAQAGLLALRGDRMDPVAAESRVKNLLSEDPRAEVLHFALGNEYARQGRWGEAQDAYFKAYAEDPDNPDFAYNVAVSLEHLRKPRLALEYYRRALALSARRNANFDRAAAHRRIEALGRSRTIAR
jgi:Tfp pilus assembly protein PilF